ncbi:MAG: tetratricopeptide repeat protein [Firmicutes bacterium]|nr:tetratricopeptide repeat protein [Bacillota bacterium]
MGFFKDMKAQRALAAHKKGNYEEACALYGEAYAEGMDKARFLLPYAVLLLRKGEYEKAREVLKKVEKAPGGITPEQRKEMLTSYAVASWKLGRLEYALDLLREVYRKGPNGSIYGTLGFLLIEKGDLDEALAFNKEAVEYDDEDPVALDNLAQTYYRLGNEKEEARKWFEKAIKCKKNAIDTNYFLALYDKEAGKLDDAREKLETAREGRFSPLNYATIERIDALLGEMNAMTEGEEECNHKP